MSIHSDLAIGALLLVVKQYSMLVVVLKNTWFESKRNIKQYSVCSSPESVLEEIALLHIFVDRFAGLSLCVLGQLARQHQLASALDSSCVHRRLFVVFHDVSSFDGNPVERVMDESVHHVHGPFRHSDLRMDLLQHLENVQVERLGPLLLVSSRSTASLWGSGRHCAC